MNIYVLKKIAFTFSLGGSKDLGSLSHGAPIVVHRPPFGLDMNKRKSYEKHGWKKKYSLLWTHSFPCAIGLHPIIGHVRFHTQTISFLL